ncbi:SRPBCC family protein [Reichenbachiella sp.]|uniref:SRPBCC family protein n=1 Tax=Reichenbachiella sp. TaxID=2184521 RepID=UPI003BAF16AE
MPTLKNNIIIDAPLASIWKNLAELELLPKLDPAAKQSKKLSETNSGLHSKRRVDMKDGENWFEEECTVFRENEALKYELTACSFPVHSLSHEYHFQPMGKGKYQVEQIQTFKMKYGIAGKLLGLMIKPKWNKGIKGFLNGLKQYSEQN